MRIRTTGQIWPSVPRLAATRILLLQELRHQGVHGRLWSPQLRRLAEEALEAIAANVPACRAEAGAIRERLQAEPDSSVPLVEVYRLLLEVRPRDRPPAASRYLRHFYKDRKRTSQAFRRAFDVYRPFPVAGNPFPSLEEIFSHHYRKMEWDALSPLDKLTIFWGARRQTVIQREEKAVVFQIPQQGLSARLEQHGDALIMR